MYIHKSENAQLKFFRINFVFFIFAVLKLFKNSFIIQYFIRINDRWLHG